LPLGLALLAAPLLTASSAHTLPLDRAVADAALDDLVMPIRDGCGRGSRFSYRHQTGSRNNGSANNVPYAPPPPPAPPPLLKKK